MTDVPCTNENVAKHVPWNKGRSLALSRHPAQSMSGQSGQSFKSKVGSAIWRYSTAPSIASFAVATSSP
jgi:hypothetical protein